MAGMSARTTRKILENASPVRGGSVSQQNEQSRSKGRKPTGSEIPMAKAPASRKRRTV